MNKDTIYYANDGTRFSSIIDRDHYNNELEKKERSTEEEEK